MDWWSLVIQYALISAFIAFLTCYVIYYIVFAVNKPQLACRNGAWKDFLLENVPIIQERFWPTPWCVDGRLQTIFAYLVRSKMPRYQYQRETLTLKDGGIVSLDWTSKPNRKDQPILMILPGLTGSSQCEYIKGFVYNVMDMDLCCVIFNHRGTAKTDLKNSRVYCGANSDDLEEAIQHIHSLYPESPLVASGISLGGMVLGNYLVTRGEEACRYLRAVIVFSVPLDLVVCTESIEKPFLNLMINQNITKGLKKIFHSFRKQLDGDYPWNYDYLMKSKTLREFDARFTSLNFGFQSVDDYYKAASLHEKLVEVRVPLLCLTAADDIFLPKEGIPMEMASRSSHVALMVTSRGGHIGFMEGLVPYWTLYSDRVLRQYLRSVLGNLEKLRQVKQEGDEFLKSP